jgi:hypothetical protein
MNPFMDEMLKARSLFDASVRAYKVALDKKDPSRDQRWQDRLRYESDYLEKCRNLCEVMFPTVTS